MIYCDVTLFCNLLNIYFRFLQRFKEDGDRNSFAAYYNATHYFYLMLGIIDDICKEFGQQYTQDIFLINLGGVYIERLSYDPIQRPTLRMVVSFMQFPKFLLS